MEHFINALKQYADFDGRWTRTQYWMFFLFYFIFAVVVSIIDGVLGLGILTPLYGLALLIPSIAAAVRRLHDTGRSGWWVLISFVPLIGAIILIVLLAMPSKEQAAAA